jgi:hypothetical protein
VAISIIHRRNLKYHLGYNHENDISAKESRNHRRKEKPSNSWHLAAAAWRQQRRGETGSALAPARGEEESMQQRRNIMKRRSCGENLAGGIENDSEESGIENTVHHRQ